MKFKIIPGSKLFNDLRELLNKANSAASYLNRIDQNFPECTEYCSKNSACMAACQH